MNCPDDTEIAMFVRGEFSPDAISRFEEHLDQCDSCLARIADIAETARPISGSGLASYQRPSVFAHLIAALARRSERTIDFDSQPHRERFGPYRVVDQLGRGAMGVVYRAIDEASGREVAIKTVARPSPSLLTAMRQEIAFLERARNPGIVSILDNGVVDGDPWYAMEVLDGSTLDQFNRRLWQGRSEGVSALMARSSAAE